LGFTFLAHPVYYNSLYYNLPCFENAFVSCRLRMYITSKIKHALKLKTSHARLAQLLQPSLAFCFSLQPMTAYRHLFLCFIACCDRSLYYIASRGFAPDPTGALALHGPSTHCAHPIPPYPDYATACG